MLKARRRQDRPRRDWGRAFALVLCAIFAFIGAVPLALGVLVRAAPVQAWAARETAALLQRELGVSARYRVRVQAWPLQIALHDLTIDASDGGSPFLEVERVAIRPRLFSLLAGHLDAGDVEILGPRARVVLEGGELRNLALPPRSSEPSQDGGLDRAPFSSIAVTDARLDLTVEGARATAREVDLDVSAEEGRSFEIAARSGLATVTRAHPLPGREGVEDSIDEDVICRFDARVRVEPGSVLVRRLTLVGAADLDPDAGTAPSCGLPRDDWRAASVELGALRLSGLGAGLPSRISGRVRARLPAGLAHRFADIPYATGAVSLDIEAEYEAGARLPRIEGHLRAEQPGIDGKVFSSLLTGRLHVLGDTVRLSEVEAHWADGVFLIDKAEIKPFAPGIPLTAGPITLEGVELTGLLRDLGAHPRAHVHWTLREGGFEHLEGTLDPLALSGPLTVESRDFAVYDRPSTEPGRRRMMGVHEGAVRGDFQIRPNAVVLSDFLIETPRARSLVRTTVSLGFSSVLGVEIHPGSRVDLAEVGPLLETIELGGVAELRRASMHGPFGHPKLTADVTLESFNFGGFPIGKIEPEALEFEPLVLTLKNARVTHGGSQAKATLLRLDFQSGADVLVDGDIDTREGPGLALKDFFEIFRMSEDPRFAEYAAVARGTARVHFALGGPEDRCGGGLLGVRADMRLTGIELLGERYDDGDLDLDLLWDDQTAGADGMRIDVRSAALRKGGGSVLASARVRHGGALQGSVIASGVPLARLDALGGLGPMLDGSASLVASLGGTLARPEAQADVHVSRVRIGPQSLPPSRLTVAIRPAPARPSDEPPKRTPICKNLIGAPFDRAEYDRDRSSGDIVLDGELFGGQVDLDGLEITQQKRKVVRGKARIQALDLGTLANLIPGVAFTAAPPKGSLSATIDITRLPLEDPRRAALTLAIDALSLERSGQRLRLTRPSGAIQLAQNALQIPELRLEWRSRSGLSAAFTAGGEVRRAVTAPELDIGVRVEPTSLAKLGADIPAVRRASGTLEAELRVTGPLAALRYAGSAELRGGELDVEGLPASLDDIDVDIAVGGGEVRLKSSAKLGSGTVTATGRMPLRGLTMGTAQAAITARGVKLPVAEGVNLTADADLDASFRPSLGIGGGVGGSGDDDDGERELPDVRGTISLTSFSYTRPIALSVDLGDLAGRRRTDVETYDPARDVVRFAVTVVSPKPLRFSNNLVDMKLEVSQPGLSLSGTNQRFGGRGTLRILPGSSLSLRTTQFDVSEGHVRFDDPYRIAPKVDVRAETEYRRYTASSATPTAAGGAAPASGTGADASVGGQWRIKMHAHGDAENLRLGLTSDPPLSQEDIVLLLTLGMTRAEVDRGLATSLGETVGLEALSTLTGADKAVKTIVPIIDEFRFGSGYSTRTGRSEPNVTVGKRITDSLRANVTTGLNENREVRSSIEWRLRQGVSVQGSYDNANDISSSPIGNIGADLRWRIEFE